MLHEAGEKELREVEMDSAQFEECRLDGLTAAQRAALRAAEDKAMHGADMSGYT